ncbi:MAG: hypothetical protein AAFU60_17775 [Bacteroidota bacterium]
MKPILLLFSLFLLNFSLSAQCINGTKSGPIYEVGGKLVKDFDEQGAEIVRIEYDLIFSAKDSYRILSPDWEYIIVGFADEGVKDLNLKLYVWNSETKAWDFVTEDTSQEVYGFITVKPEARAEYKVEIIAETFHEGYTAARYGLLYLHE